MIVRRSDSICKSLCGISPALTAKHFVRSEPPIQIYVNHPKVRHDGIIPFNRIQLYIVVLAVLSMTAAPASAKILKTLGQALKSKVLTLTVGQGLEYQTDSEQTQYDLPFLLERSLTKNLKLTVEPNYIYIHNKVGPSVHGFGELETSLTFDFLSERRNRPGFSALGVIKWPTASHAELGTGKTDYSLGMIASKEFVHADLDFNALYTFVGSPPGTSLRNTLETSLAMDWHVSRHLCLEGELLAINGAGTIHGRYGAVGGTANRENSSELSITLGLAEQVKENVKLEEGMIVQSDGSWQAVLAWEWNIGGED